MDLVKIRKKAKEKKTPEKKVKDRKNDASDSQPKKTALKSSRVEQGSAGKKEKVEPNAALVAVDNDNTEVKRSADQYFNETDNDFLSLTLEALYQEGYEGASFEADEEEKIEFLCFMLSDEEYAVALGEVREIIKYSDITDVPKTPPYLAGIISLRGSIIPIFDLRVRLGLATKEYDRKTRIIIVSNKDRPIGIIVDSVTEVVRLKKSDLQETPSLLNNIDTELLSGVGRYDDRLLIIPKLTKIFDVKV